MPNQKYNTLESLSERQKTLTGLGLILLSLITGLLMYSYPYSLKVPVFIALIALSVFFISGIAVLIHGKITGESYHRLMQSLILLMSIIPLWIAFDPSEKECRADLYFFSGDISCRVGFGVGGLVLILLFFFTFNSFKEEKHK